MGQLNLNFSEQTVRHEPTKYEICQIECLAHSIKAIIKALYVYSSDYHHGDERSREFDFVCVGICNALELLIDPVIEYKGNYAGGEAAPEIIGD